jgi:hypothetical protein
VKSYRKEVVMKTLIRILDAERLKLKRTLALWMAFIAPLSVALYIAVAFLLGGEEMLPPSHEGVWSEFLQVVSIFWALLMLPLFATLQTALLGGLEHRNGQWKHLYALPVPRWAVVLAKQMLAAALMALSHAALIVFAVAGGWMLWLLRPGLGFHAAIPWGPFLQRVGAVYLASWLILAVHTWVGLRWRNFVVALAVGIVLTVAGMIAINSRWGSFYPWALAGGIVNALNKGGPFRLAEFLFGSVGGIVAALLGCWEITRHDVQ